jgi:putative membrane protein
MLKKVLQAWSSGPGPNSVKEYLVLILKGLCMGMADIIPGVSGGTMAFITGIYGQLIDSIRSFDLVFFKKFLTFDFFGAIERAHFKFIIPLLFGILLAMVSVANIIHYFLVQHPIPLWSLFFGLIAASILVVGRRTGNFSYSNFLIGLIGAVGSYYLVGMIPVTTQNDLWFVFLCATVAICAMILPGISGAFILLLLGKYEYITGALRNPALPGNITVLLVFIAGCAVGISLFSRVLHYFLERYHNATISLLTGFMAGAMRKVWPWKEVLDSVTIRGKVHVLSETNVLPPAFDSTFWLAVFLALVGFAAVLFLEWMSSARNG